VHGVGVEIEVPKVSLIVARLPDLSSVLDSPSSAALTTYVNSMIATGPCRLVRDTAVAVVVPHVAALCSELARAFPDRRISSDLSVYEPLEFTTCVEKTMLAARQLGAQALAVQAEVLGRTYTLLGFVRELAAELTVVSDTGVPDAVREKFCNVRLAMSPVRAFVTAPNNFLTEHWRRASDWNPADVSDAAPAALPNDALTAAASECDRCVQIWSGTMEAVSTSMNAATPSWALHKEDLWSPAAKITFEAMLATGSPWAWPEPPALKKSGLLQGMIGFARRLARDGHVQLIDASIIKNAKTTSALASETAALTYTLHVLFNVLPKLDKLDLRTTCATTLQAQIVSSTLSVAAWTAEGKWCGWNGAGLDGHGWGAVRWGGGH
jgi:hypothetical protein